MTKGKGRVVVTPGVNAIGCTVCKDGTVFIPITMRGMAKLRSGYTLQVTTRCNNGHSQTVDATGWSLHWGKLNFDRT